MKMHLLWCVSAFSEGSPFSRASTMFSSSLSLSASEVLFHSLEHSLTWQRNSISFHYWHQDDVGEDIVLTGILAAKAMGSSFMRWQKASYLQGHPDFFPSDGARKRSPWLGSIRSMCLRTYYASLHWKSIILFLCVCVFACIYVYAPSVSLVPAEVRRAHWSPGTGVRDI